MKTYSLPTLIHKLFAFSIALLIPGVISAKTYDINTGDFDRIHVPDNIEIIYTATSKTPAHAVYEAPKGFDNIFIFNNVSGKLTVQVQTELLEENEVPVLKLYSHKLTELESSSDRNFTAGSLPAVETFNVTLMDNGNISIGNIKANDVKAAIATGNGNISIGGECDRAILKMIGRGTIQASKLMSQTAACTILGGGEIDCWPLDSLVVKGIGSTKIYYKGMPEVKKRGGGKVMPLCDRHTKN